MLAQKLAEYICQCSYEDLPENVVTMAKLCVIDWMGSALIGASYPPARKVAALMQTGPGGSATAVGAAGKASPVSAALFNGVASHTVELDDLHRKTMLHPGTTVISAAWAAAESVGAGGKDLIAAVTVGYEVAVRAAEAVGESHFEYWYPTGTCGVFGAAAASARVLDLSVAETVYALGNAGTQAAGLWEFHVHQAMSKQLHAGKAAADGLRAALLAREGFTGPGSIFEGSRGFLKAYSRQPRPALLEQGLGEGYKILETGFKLYPSGRHTHGGIDLALRLRDRGLRAQDIELIRIKSYRLARELAGNPEPGDPVEAKFSLPFCVATTLLYGHPTLDCFCRERVDDDLVRRLMAHTTVEVDPELDLLYPNYWPTIIEVIDRSGHITRERTDYPKGDPENPAAAAEIQRKFLELATRSLGEDRAGELLHALLNLEQCADIGKLL